MAIQLKQNWRQFRKVIFLLLLTCVVQIAKGADEGQIILKVVDSNGQPLAKAKIYQYYALHHNQQFSNEYICDVNGVVEINEANLFQCDQPVSLYGLYEDKLAGFMDVNTNDLGNELIMTIMTLTPACHISGKIKSTKLAEQGQKLELSNIYIYRDQDRLMSELNKKYEYEFILPSGAYTIRVTGDKIFDYFENVVLEPNQKDLRLNYDISADRLVYMAGKQAPELNRIKGWLTVEPLKLSDLRGHVILLDFFKTCCRYGAGPMPKLKDLYEKYEDKGFIIIAIHADTLDSIGEMKEKIARLSKEYWSGIEIPFAVALDGGGKCTIERTAKSTSGATTAAYGIQNWPVMILLDKQGVVVKEFNPDQDIPLLEQLLSR